MTVERCVRDGCVGTIDDEGFCIECNLRPPAVVDPGRLGPSSQTEIVPASAARVPEGGESLTKGTTSGQSETSGPQTAATRRSRLGAGLVKIAPVPARDPLSLVLRDPAVPERSRLCSDSTCAAPVGRSRGDKPGAVEGHCHQCRRPYSFLPLLKPGDVVAGQYEIAGCLAHGGQGWIYLARDRKVGFWVVLKGLLNSGDDEAVAAAIAERRFLAEVEHPDIVRIYNFVEHGGDGYIVMEHVNGLSLRAMLQQRKADNGGVVDPMPVAHALGYVQAILPALGSLHDRGLLFCDFKPDNVMQAGDRVKLIDLGGAYRMDGASTSVFGTAGYQAPEIAESGPSIESDLYTVGRTLAMLCTDFRGNLGQYAYTLPPREDVDVYRDCDSLYRLISRATALDVDERFHSAEEMETQLLGVLREVVAESTNTPTGAPSSLFTGEGRGSAASVTWQGLPRPLPNLDDTAAPVIVSVSSLAAEDALAVLATSPDPTAELQLWRARLLIDLERYDEADAALDEVAVSYPREWRGEWYRALIELSRANPGLAAAHLERVYHHLPGELAVKLALGVAAESAGELDAAAGWYGIVARTDPTFTSGVFGLARVSKAMGDRDAAVAALERIPHHSSAYTDAQQMEIDVLLECPATSAADLGRSETILGRLRLTPDETSAKVAQILERALEVVHSDESHTSAGGTLFGRPLTERGVRLGLESTYRSLARRAEGDVKIGLVDRANQIRPVSWL